MDFDGRVGSIGGFGGRLRPHTATGAFEDLREAMTFQELFFSIFKDLTIIEYH